MTRFSGGLVAFIALALTAGAHGQDASAPGTAAEAQSGPAARLKRSDAFVAKRDDIDWTTKRDFTFLSQADCLRGPAAIKALLPSENEIKDAGDIWPENHLAKTWLNGPIAKDPFSHDLSQRSFYCQVGDNGGLVLPDASFEDILSQTWCNGTDQNDLQILKVPVWEPTLGFCASETSLASLAYLEDDIRKKCGCMAHKQNPTHKG